jgi:hypothetical protein
VGRPDSPENILRLQELIFRYGRQDDTMHIAADDDGSLKPGRRRIIQFDAFPGAQLTSPTDDLPPVLTIMKVAGTGLLLHAQPGRVTEALVPHAVPENARVLTVRFSHRNARASAARMGFAVRLDGEIVTDSGWVDVAPGSYTYAAVEIEKPNPNTGDLLLRSTAGESPNYAWTYADHLIVEFGELHSENVDAHIGRDFAVRSRQEMSTR